MASASVNILKRYFVASDSKGLVECHNLGSGDVRWTYNLPGAPNIIAQKDHVLIHQGYEAYSTSVVLLELSTGRELFHKEPQANEQYLRAYFDGEQAYVAIGSASKGESGEAGARGSPATCTRFLAWDLAGKETANFEAPPTVRGKDSYDLDHQEFTLVGRRFTPSGLICPEGSECADVGPIVRRNSWTRNGLSLQDGSIQIRNSVKDVEGDQGTVVERVSGAGGWRGYLPYLRVNGRIAQASVADDSLLLGSNMGHVECVEVTTGRTRWLYVFPAILQTQSFSFPYSMPPYYADRAKRFRRANADNRNVIGLIRLPTTFSEDTVRWTDVAASAEKEKLTVIVDPSPQDPFKDLPFFLAAAWTGAAAPTLLLALVVLAARETKRKLPRWALAGLWAVVLVVGGANLYENGRVAFSSTAATKLVVVYSTCFLLFHIVRLFKERRMIVAAIYLGLLLVSAYLFYIPMRYA